MSEHTFYMLLNEGVRLNWHTHSIANAWGITLSDPPVYIGAQWGVQ